MIFKLLQHYENKNRKFLRKVMKVPGSLSMICAIDLEH